LITVSLCMIVKNEEDTIGRCLESVKGLLDEIVIVDTGSTDKTKEIVSQYTDRVFDFVWIEDFAAARNFAFSQAKMDYIFWLDADDVLMKEDYEKFLTLKETLDPSVDSVTMNYHLSFDDNGNLNSSIRRNRLVKKHNNYKWIGAVHEYLEVWGNIIDSEIAVTHSKIHHDSDRNLRIYENRLKKGEEFSPRDLFYFANELIDHQMYERAIYYYEKFLATEKGWIEDNIAACGKIADCYFHLKEPEKEYESIIRSFQFDHPRPEFCCRLGYYFLHKNEFKVSAFWYELALKIDISKNNWGFQNHACSTWLPHLQLSVCYERLGEFMKSYHHNEIARQYQPNHPSVIHNKKNLESILKMEVQEGESQTQE